MIVFGFLILFLFSLDGLDLEKAEEKVTPPGCEDVDNLDLLEEERQDDS